MTLETVEETLAGKKVLVTGATGFIGSHLVERLVKLKANVTAIGPTLGFRPIVKRFVGQERAHFVKLNAFWSPAALGRVKSDFQGTEYVVHLAYVMPRGQSILEKTIDDLRRNVHGTVQFIKSLPESVSKICFASSSMVYGPNPPNPVSESTCVNPISVYSCGKLATENYLQLYGKDRSISISILRYATVYGPWETDPRAIPNFIRCVLAGKPPVIYGGGDDIRDYVHVSDVVEATLLTLANDTNDHQVFNIGSGKGYSTCQIAERIIELTGKCLEPIHKQSNHVINRIVYDVTHANRVLGYQPLVDLNKGLMDEIQFFSNHPIFWK